MKKIMHFSVAISWVLIVYTAANISGYIFAIIWYHQAAGVDNYEHEIFESRLRPI